MLLSRGVTCDARLEWRDDRVINMDIGLEVMGAYQMRLYTTLDYVGWRSSEMQDIEFKKVQGSRQGKKWRGT